MESTEILKPVKKVQCLLEAGKTDECDFAVEIKVIQLSR